MLAIPTTIPGVLVPSPISWASRQWTQPWLRIWFTSSLPLSVLFDTATKSLLHSLCSQSRFRIWVAGPSPGYRISRIRVEARASRMARLTTATRSKSSTRRRRVAILAPRITSLSVFVSMLKAAVRKGLSATSCTCARGAVETTRLWSARQLRRQRLTAATTDLRLHVGGYKHCVSFQAGIGLPLSRATCANWLRPSTAISAPRWWIRWWIGKLTFRKPR